MLFDPATVVRDALSGDVPAPPMRSIRERAVAMRRQHRAQWSSFAFAVVALLLFAAAPVNQTPHSVPVPVPAPQPTIT